MNEVVSDKNNMIPLYPHTFTICTNSPDVHLFFDRVEIVSIGTIHVDQDCSTDPDCHFHDVKGLSTPQTSVRCDAT